MVDSFFPFSTLNAYSCRQRGIILKAEQQLDIIGSSAHQFRQKGLFIDLGMLELTHKSKTFRDYSKAQLVTL